VKERERDTQTERERESEKETFYSSLVEFGCVSANIFFMLEHKSRSLQTHPNILQILHKSSKN
jgi:hypothetical protein